jgi:type III restriction enzyme
MIQKLVLNNSVIFSEILSKSTARYKKILEETSGKNGAIKDFEIQGSKAYSRETYKEVKSDLALYQPFRMKLVDSDNQLVNKLEKAFIHYLDSKPEHIDWHWHNGDERMEINFGISYSNGTSTFQPDFIVKFKDGRIGIFDTKPIDYNLEDTKIKANALFRYLEEQNKMRDSIHGKLVGGIVVSNSSNYINFYFYNEPEYVDFKESQNKWKTFDSLL